jgi:hypothetical protein
MMKNLYRAALLAVLAAALGCQHETPAVGHLDVQPRTVSLAYPQLTTIHLTWTPLAASDAGGAVPSSPQVFLHLLDAKGQVLRTFDHPFPQRWAAGAPVGYDVNLYQSALAPPLAAGTYRLTVGLYDSGGKRFALEGLGKAIGRNEFQAASVVVPAPGAGPRVTFSPSWLPVEAGTDKQVVARRWLGDQAGDLRVDAIPAAGTFWMSFRIPPGDGAEERLVRHDAASNTAAAVVRGTCGAVETGISGTGLHDVEMPVDAAGAASGCGISLLPNFHILSANRPLPRSVSLEVAAWIPAGGHAAPTQPTAGDPAAPAAPTAPAAPSAPAAPAPPAGNGGGA